MLIFIGNPWLIQEKVIIPDSVFGMKIIIDTSATQAQFIKIESFKEK